MNCPACGSLNTQWKIYLLKHWRCLGCRHCWLDFEYAHQQHREHEEFNRRNPDVVARAETKRLRDEIEGWKP